MRVIDLGLCRYADTQALQLEAVGKVSEGGDERLVLVEHPPVITFGRNGGEENLPRGREYFYAQGVEIVQTARGGNITCHFPGQLVAYPVIRLMHRKGGLRRFFTDLEESVIITLARYGLSGTRRDGFPGVWIDGRKICSIGIGVKHWITYHGLALNVDKDISLFRLISPCGMKDISATSMELETGGAVDKFAVKECFLENFRAIFGVTFHRGGGDAVPLTEPSTAPEKTKSASRLPVWIRRPLLHGRTFAETKNQVNSCGIPTVCRNAKCPNMGECYSRGMATFLILGEVCTRNCAFCNIAAGLPRPLDPEEPARLAAAVAALQLHHTVITSVTRDDLEDGGAAHFAACILAVRKRMPSGAVEVLVPDFRGSLSAIQTVLDAAPHVLTHNVETHPSLYSVVRPMADYRRSLDLLRHAARAGKAVAKSGFMVGLGETDEHVREILADLMEAGCRIVTVGQYLQPSRTHLPVARFVHPDDFVKYASWGREVGIPFVFSAPLVRSSYQARESFGELNVEIPVSPSEACRAGGRKRGLRQKSSRRPG